MKLRKSSIKNIPAIYQGKTHSLTSVARSGTESTRLCVGLDVHKDSIVVAIACDDSVLHQLCVEDRGTIPNQLTRLIKLLDKTRDDHHATLYVVYEAGPCGYVIYRYLQAHGYACDVIAPSLMPTQPGGGRVKTDRRDARKLASYARYGALTQIWVPDATQEAIRDLIRHRIDVKRGR